MLLGAGLSLRRSAHSIPSSLRRGRPRIIVNLFLTPRFSSTTTITNNFLHDPSRQVYLSRIADESSASAFIAKLVLNRPKANAMGAQFMREFQECLSVLEEKTDSSSLPSFSPRCVILTSSNDKVFCAGADLKERAAMTLDEAEQCVDMLRSTMERVARLPMPVLASIEGVAVGGGLELALAADIRIASTDAALGLPETSLAIIPGAGGTQRLSRLVGVARAKELIWTGRRIGGQEAFDYGLVQKVVSPGQALQSSLEIANRIASHGPIAIQAAKEAIDSGIRETDMDNALKVERRCYAKTLPTQDRLEGLVAFRERRKPEYKGH